MGMSYPPYLLAASNTGNTAGNTGTSFGTFVLAASTNITVSQSTATNNVHTLWLSGAAGGGGSFSAGVSTGGNTSGSTGTVSNQIVFAGGNNITLSQSTAAGGATVTISAFNQSNQTLGIYATSNTFSSSSGTYDARSLTVRGIGNASVGMSNGSLLFSVAAGGGVTFNAGVYSQSTSNSTGFIGDKLSIYGQGIVSVGLSDNELSISATQSNQSLGIYAVSNTTQGSSGTVDARTLSFNGAGGVSVGVTNGSIVISGGAGGAEATFRSTNIGNVRGWAQSSSSLGQNSLYIFPENLQEAVFGSAFKIPLMVTHSSSAASAQTRGFTARFGIYTRNATNETVLTQHYSTSYTASFSCSSNVSWNIGVITGLGNSTSYNSVSASSAGLNLSASVHGPRELLIPCATTLTAGEYWFAYVQSSSTAGANNNLFNVSHIIASSQTVNKMGVSQTATQVGIARNIGLGTYSATTGALPNGISLTQINAAATNPVLYFGGYTE